MVFDSVVFFRYDVTSCTHWWVVAASMAVLMDYRKIKHGDAGPLGIYPILSVLPDKFARFLFEFHSVRFESLDLPPLPADRSNFDVHGALEDDKVKISKGLYYTYYDTSMYYIHSSLFLRFVNVVLYVTS